MARHTREEMLLRLQTLTGQEKVFKVEVDEAKSHLSYTYDYAKRAINEEFTFAGKWENLSPVEREVDVPYVLQHLFGKKFLKSLNDAIAKAGRTPYLDAIGHLVSEMSPLNTLMQALIARQVKGRRPPEPKTVIGTRTQLRAICPCCFRQQAVDDANRMVSHGYTLDYGYQNGICYGFRKPHFGTVEGRTIAELAETKALFDAGMIEKNADIVEADPSVHTIRDYYGKEIKAPDVYQIESHIYRMRSSAQQCRQYASFINLRLASWKLADPVEVTVDITE